MTRVVTAHQPNFLPGVSVIEKVLACDAVVWVDDVDYAHYSFTARNVMPNGKPLSVPLIAPSRHRKINRVEIDNRRRGWKGKMCRTLKHHYGTVADPYAEEISRPYGLLVGLNNALLQRMLRDLGYLGQQHWQSQLMGGIRLETVYDDRKDTGLRRKISKQLAAMTFEVGGDVYMSGPSGDPSKGGYLWTTPFDALGIEVRYWKHEGPNPCALDLVKRYNA